MNQIYVNDIQASISEKIKLRDVVSISLNYEEDNSNVVPKEMDLHILYEDEYMLILDKPADIAIHPSNNHYDNSLSNGVRFYFDSIGLKKKIRLVNRLDRGTSGIVVYAKNEYIQERLANQMVKNKFKKEYIAVVDGIVKQQHGTIDAPIARVPGSIMERCINSSGDYAITHYEVLKTLEKENMSIVKLNLGTGRTHQIRVHLKFIGHPIVGDTLYNIENEKIDRQALHAYKIEFIHPVNKKQMKVLSDLPNDIYSLSKSISRILS